MKYILTIIALITAYNTQAQGIKFEENLTWSQVQAKAKSENKYILVDAYATWCGPCKGMSAEVFPNKEVGDFINDKYIAVKIQMDRTAEDSYATKSWYDDAKSIDQQYKITGYPTILFFSPEGKLVHRIVGYRDAKSLVKDAKDALNPQTQYYSLWSLYESGKRDSAFVKRIALLADQIGQTETAKKISQQFIDKLSIVELFKKTNLQFAYKFITSSKDKLFPILIKQTVKINSVLGKNAAEIKIKRIVGKEEIEPYLANTAVLPNWSKIEQTVKAKYGNIGLEKVYGAEMIWYGDKKDWANFGKYYALYYNTAITRSEYHINNVSWTVFEQIADPKVLNVAVKAAKYSMENFSKYDPIDIDTYANLLYKAERKQLAIEWEEKAVQKENENAAKGNRKPDPVFEETLEKMKAGVKTWTVEESKK